MTFASPGLDGPMESAPGERSMDIDCEPGYSGIHLRCSTANARCNTVSFTGVAPVNERRGRNDEVRSPDC